MFDGKLAIENLMNIMISENKIELIETILHFIKGHGGQMGEGSLYNAIQTKLKDDRGVPGMKEAMEEYQDTLDFLLEKKVLDRNIETGVNFILTDNFRWLLTYDHLLEKIEKLENEELLKTKLLEVNVENAESSKFYRRSSFWFSLLALLIAFGSLIATFLDESPEQKEIMNLEKRVKILENSLNPSDTGRASMRQETDSIPKTPETQQNLGIQEN